MNTKAIYKNKIIRIHNNNLTLLMPQAKRVQKISFMLKSCFIIIAN